MSRSWYYHDGQKQAGPIEESALRLMIEHGVIGPDHLVFGPGLTAWSPARALSMTEQRSEQPPPIPSIQGTPIQFSPQSAVVSGPSLWNPSAAANWCLLFGAPFGSFLHAKNWAALGEHEKSRNSWIWFFSTSTLILLSVFASPVAAAGIGFWALILWYFISARPQIKFVADKFGSNGYTRKSWAAPLLIVFFVNACFIFFALILFVAQAVAQA